MNILPVARVFNKWKIFPVYTTDRDISYLELKPVFILMA